MYIYIKEKENFLQKINKIHIVKTDSSHKD